MKFCPIMPVTAFEKFGNVSDHWMALAQHLADDEYRKFFERKLEKGDTVILDNGAYEGVQMSAVGLHCWVKRLKPSVVVLPDSPGDFMKTLHKSLNFLDMGLPHGTEGMMVLHAEDGKLAHFETAYELCPTKWIGFSRLTHKYGNDVAWPYHRWVFVAWLKDRGLWRPELNHHALGMLNGNLLELRQLNRQGFRSCDSSAPIWRGLLGYKLNDPWPGYEMILHPDTEASNFPLVESNLQEVFKACGQD